MGAQTSQSNKRKRVWMYFRTRTGTFSLRQEQEAICKVRAGSKLQKIELRFCKSVFTKFFKAEPKNLQNSFKPRLHSSCSCSRLTFLTVHRAKALTVCEDVRECVGEEEKRMKKKSESPTHRLAAFFLRTKRCGN